MPAPATAPRSVQAVAPAASGFFLIGLICLGVAAFASTALVLDHFNAFDLPGCGAASDCERAAQSVWGRVPGLQMPVSFLGAAYFLALLATWLVTAGRAGRALRGLIWLGGFVSLFFLGVVVFEQLFCKWCITAHIANLVFLFLNERAFKPERFSLQPVALVASLFGGTLATLSFIDHSKIGAARLENQRVTQAIKAAASQPAVPTVASAPSPSQPSVAAANSNGIAPVAAPERTPFTGRYRLGPDPAPIRIVMFTDYQCPDCRIFEREVMTILKERPSEVSLSVKHFPFCTACNPYTPNLHGNACFAARAAEAAGILGGNDAFWKMHLWLFEKGGKFESNAILAEGVAGAGLEMSAFVPLMTGEDSLRNVKADIEEAVTYGIERTPMIFVNGVELKKWRVPKALTQMVTELAAANLPPRGADADRPPDALERNVALWGEEPQRTLPELAGSVSFGTAGATPQIVMWGDLQDPASAKADRAFRAFIASRGGEYRFLHYPWNKECNPGAANSRVQMNNGCRIAKAVVAAEIVGGIEAARRVHEWAVENAERFSDDALRQFASTIGLDPAKLLAAAAGPEAVTRIEADLEAGKKLQLTGIPRIYVNQKQVQRWNQEGYPILETILDKAASR